MIKVWYCLLSCTVTGCLSKWKQTISRKEGHTSSPLKLLKCRTNIFCKKAHGNKISNKKCVILESCGKRNYNQIYSLMLPYKETKEIHLESPPWHVAFWYFLIYFILFLCATLEGILPHANEINWTFLNRNCLMILRTYQTSPIVIVLFFIMTKWLVSQQLENDEDLQDSVNA